MFIAQWRRWILRVILLQSMLFSALFVLWSAYPRYIPTNIAEAVFSPNGRFFAEPDPPNPSSYYFYGGNLSDGWREISYRDYHGARFFAWSSNSHYAVVVFVQHYGVTDLGIFDTQAWRWYFADSCMQGAMTSCALELPLATNGRFLYLMGGTMYDLTGEPDMSRWKWHLGLYGSELAAWSLDNRYLAVVGSELNGSRALYIGGESGHGMQAVMMLPPDFKVNEIRWAADTSEITVMGSVERMHLNSTFEMAHYSFVQL
jgi:hypothetical protein